MSDIEQETTPDQEGYYKLTPDVVLNAVESLGYRCDGRFLALNSYENRVYRINLEEAPAIVTKFYRPHRWSDAAILEEHQFTQELSDLEIPVVAPLKDPQGQTLHSYEGFRFAVYPNCGGRWPELDNEDNLTWIGRFIGRIHAYAKTDTFKHRPEVDIDSYGWQPLQQLEQSQLLPLELKSLYVQVAQQVLEVAQQRFNETGKLHRFRLHADCHPGNILWTDDGPHFVDFDDARNGPAVQDLWMLLSGDRRDMTLQLDCVLEGYTEFCDFEARELNLIEPLRSLRLIHYSAWLTNRWSDPSFPANFPWFAENKYWEEQILALKEQLSLMQEPPLHWA